MRDDLLDAHAAVDWGKAQLPVLERRCLSWNEHAVELVVVDEYLQSGQKAWVALEKTPLPAIINAEAGAIIGSLRSSLDLLAAALAKRNGVRPSEDTHFPIFGSLYDMIDPIYGLECKKWLSQAEISAIKALEPYRGGNKLLWPLHHLNNVRKHERLVVVNVRPKILNIIAEGWQPGSNISPSMLRLKDTTLLFEISRDAPDPNIQLLLEVVFDEMIIGVFSKPLVRTLREFASTADSIIRLFGG